MSEDVDEESQMLMGQLDGSGSNAEWAAVMKLRQREDFPRLLLQRFRSSRAWRVRTTCVYHATRYARDDADAVTLGEEALSDKSKVVRYRACMLLAYSQRTEVLLALRRALATTKSSETSADLVAAIDAIECGNCNFFVDRDHSGKVSIKFR